ncbi:MAG: NADH-quinone oxidoreductase subunit J family protein [Planctomycetaceae bacterium]
MTAFFWIFALLIVVAALLAITRRNAVSTALWASLAFVGIAGEFVLLSAFFLAVVEVLVYAGAIMVLFLFVIMLLNLREKDLRLTETPRLHWAGLLLAGLFLAGVVVTCRRAGLFSEPLVVKGEAVGETAHLAPLLFQRYLLPFEIASFLLLAAIVGAVLLTKRRLS